MGLISNDYCLLELHQSPAPDLLATYVIETPAAEFESGGCYIHYGDPITVVIQEYGLFLLACLVVASLALLEVDVIGSAL